MAVSAQRVAVMGLSAGGKSTLINYLKTGRFSAKWIRTLGVEETVGRLNGRSVTFVEFSVCFMEGMLIGPPTHLYSTFDLILVCIDRTWRDGCLQWLACNLAHEFGTNKYMIVYTKCDRQCDIGPRECVASALCISSKTGNGISELKGHIVKDPPSLVHASYDCLEAHDLMNDYRQSDNASLRHAVRVIERGLRKA